MRVGYRHELYGQYVSTFKGAAHAADDLRAILRHARVPEERAVELWQRILAIVQEFSRLPRSGDTVFGLAAGLYPTEYPTLPDPAVDDG